MLTIGELAHRTGVSVRTLRFYDESGVVMPTARQSGQRRYGHEAVEQVALVRLCQRAGFRLTEVAELVATHASDEFAWRDRVAAKLTDIDRQIRQLRLAKAGLTHALHCPEADIMQCPTFLAVLAQAVTSR